MPNYVDSTPPPVSVVAVRLDADGTVRVERRRKVSGAWTSVETATTQAGKSPLKFTVSLGGNDHDRMSAVFTSEFVGWPRPYCNPRAFTLGREFPFGREEANADLGGIDPPGRSLRCEFSSTGKTGTLRLLDQATTLETRLSIDPKVACRLHLLALRVAGESEGTISFENWQTAGAKPTTKVRVFKTP